MTPHPPDDVDLERELEYTRLNDELETLKKENEKLRQRLNSMPIFDFDDVESTISHGMDVGNGSIEITKQLADKGLNIAR